MTEATFTEDYVKGLDDKGLLGVASGAAFYAGSEDTPRQEVWDDKWEYTVIPPKTRAAAANLGLVLAEVSGRVEADGIGQHPELSAIFAAIRYIPEGTPVEEVAANVRLATESALGIFKGSKDQGLTLANM